MYLPLSLLLVDLAIPIGPFPLDKVVDGFRLVGVAPQPRYPDPSVSLISDGSSPLLLAPPTAGKVGSLFGLKPYSSTSFLLSSSASFLDLCLRQKNKATRTTKATAATGTTTAIAILPPGDSPPPDEEFEVEVASAAASLDLEAAGKEVVVSILDVIGEVDVDCVDVTTTVAGGFVVATPLLLVVGGAVKTDVSMRVDCGGSVV